MRCVRIRFDKTGMSRYISHLDLMRTMTRAVRRSKIPLWYTEGFNPHPYMTFSLPLSLGMESICESMDIRVEGEITDDEILRALKSAMPEGIEIKEVYEPVLDPKFIAYGSFDITFFDAANTQSLIKSINDILSQKELVVQKSGKKGHRKVYKDINLIEYISSFELSEKEGNVILSVILPAGSTTNVNPSLLADEIQKRFCENTGYIIRRKALLTKDMEIFR